MVAGTVYVNPFTYKNLAGELIEKKIILPYEESKMEIVFKPFNLTYCATSNKLYENL